MAHFYSIGAFVIESPFVLRGVAPAKGALRPDVSVYVEPAEQIERVEKWTHRWRRRDGGLALSCARRPGGYLLRYGAAADFVIADRAIAIRARPRTAWNVVERLLIESVIPHALSRRGCVVLHASAVTDGSRAVAFAGGSGDGKSTVAASFCASGWGLLADDYIVLRKGAEVAPTHAGIRLWPDAMRAVSPDAWRARATVVAGAKTRATASVARDAVPLKHLYVLAPRRRTARAAEPSIELLSGAAALIAVVTAALRIDPSDAASAGRQLDPLARLARSLEIRRVRFTRGVRRVPQLRSAVLADLAAP